jgi:hypothetical protein
LRFAELICGLPTFGGVENQKILENSQLSLIVEQDSGVQQQLRVPEGASDRTLCTLSKERVLKTKPITGCTKVMGLFLSRFFANGVEDLLSS